MNQTNREIMAFSMKCYRDKDIFRGSDWNGADNSGGVREGEERTDGRRQQAHVWGHWNTPLHELLNHAMDIGATAILSSGPKSGWYFRNQPKEDIIQKIEGNPAMYNCPGVIIYLMN